MWFRKSTILVHRYLGIALGLLFVTWFASGIAMIYAGGMPRLTPAVRLERMPQLDLSRVRLTPSEAAARAGLTPIAARTVLLTLMDRPAYRFAGGDAGTIFADTGEPLPEIGPAEALAIAGGFTHLPPPALHHAGVLDDADQWTIALRHQTPLHKIVVDDPPHTELYVSALVGEVVMQTTRGSRSLAWVAAIPHWLYFAPLRLKDDLWRQVVLWTSGLGTVAALLGLVLAVTQRKVRYTGLMRWHYIAGTVFGVFALTWVFSGLLSMEPWGWAASQSARAPLALALGGGPLDLSSFPKVDGAAWNRLMRPRAIKELEFRRLQGEPYYVARGGGPALLIGAKHLQLRPDRFSIDSITRRVREAYPGVPIVDVEELPAYDSYYYDRDRDSPLPVLRVKLGDPERTWLYVDPEMSQLVARFTRRQRVERWLYHGLHSLDFSFWYYSPLWDIGVVALLVGGTMLSVVGVAIGIKRLRQSGRRRARSWRVAVTPSGDGRERASTRRSAM